MKGTQLFNNIYKFRSFQTINAKLASGYVRIVKRRTKHVLFSSKNWSNFFTLTPTDLHTGNFNTTWVWCRSFSPPVLYLSGPCLVLCVCFQLFIFCLGKRSYKLFIVGVVRKMYSRFKHELILNFLNNLKNWIFSLERPSLFCFKALQAGALTRRIMS